MKSIQRFSYITLIITLMMGMAFFLGSNMAHGQFSINDRLDDLEWEVNDLESRVSELESQIE